MKILKIKMVNWKCFENKTFEFTTGENIINLPNGSGKSSILQAIWFCLYDQRPAGYDFNNLRNDQNKSCDLDLFLEDDLHNEYHISRKFGIKSLFQLYKNEELVATSRQDILNTINNLLPQKVVEGLWCQDSLTKSFILDSNYLISTLEYVFKEPLEIKKYIQTDKAAEQRNINNLKNQISNPDLKLETINEVKSKIEEIEKQIKDKVFFQDSDYIKAKNCQDNESEYTKYSELLKKFDIDKLIDRNKLLTYVDITSISKFDLSEEGIAKEAFNKIREQLREEENKITSRLSKYNRNFIREIISESKENGKCILCNNDFTNDHFDNIEKELNTPELNLSVIQKLKDKLEYESLNFKDVLNSIKYNQIKKKYDQLKFGFDNCPNWKEIIDKYNKDNNNLYNELDNYKAKYEEYNKEYSKIQDLLQAQKNMQDIIEQIKIVDEYLIRAKEYYSQTLTSSASEILNKINPRYSNIIMDDNKYHVIVTDASLTETNYLPIVMLSSGEKTLVAISLIIAAQKLFAPGCPLVFDESFVNLDRDNILNLKKIFKELKIQNFIVSHDPVWLEN